MKVKLGGLKIGDFFYITGCKFMVLLISHKNNKLRCVNVVTGQLLWFDAEMNVWRENNG